MRTRDDSGRTVLDREVVEHEEGGYDVVGLAGSARNPIGVEALLAEAGKRVAPVRLANAKRPAEDVPRRGEQIGMASYSEPTLELRCGFRNLNVLRAMPRRSLEREPQASYLRGRNSARQYYEALSIERELFRRTEHGTSIVARETRSPSVPRTPRRLAAHTSLKLGMRLASSPVAGLFDLRDAHSRVL